ncbi:MAG: recombinase [Ruminococcus albus]|nr:recombinase [Ruminococcus albus]
MKHTPYGYEIINGRAVVIEEQAEKIKRIIDNYLSGLSLTAAAGAEGISMKHSGVKKMMQNKRYLGDDFYPQIITREQFDAVETELLKRSKALGRTSLKGKTHITAAPAVTFRMPSVKRKYDDPIKQAEYAYSLIESEVK